jgi:bifunctional UDP-N-acetylglucosamine pyrophosphorylase/glucosamine-1-phosphate N-acetyltransferase
MQAVILAAGEGTRMRPLTERRAKPVLPVAGRPMVEHVARAAVSAGADDLVVVVGYEADGVRSALGDSVAGVPVNYAEQPAQEGTADAVAAAREHLDGDFAVLNGDNLYEPDALTRLFDRRPSVACTRADDPSNYGVLVTDGGRVENLVEKPEEPPSDLVNAGAYVFPAEAREWLEVPESERGERELTDVLNRVVEAYDVEPIEVDGWLDVGRPWELLEANERRIGRGLRDVRGYIHEDAEIRGDVVVEPGASIDSGVVIEGPAVIQSGASVGPNASVRGATLLSPDVEVGHGVEIKNSVLMAGTSVSHLSYVGDSVLGRDVNLGAGTQVANLRHDGEPIAVTVKGERVSTGRRKFGAVLGDGVKTGVNASLDPGVKLSAGATTAPGERISRDR